MAALLTRYGIFAMSTLLLVVLGTVAANSPKPKQVVSAATTATTTPTTTVSAPSTPQQTTVTQTPTPAPTSTPTQPPLLTKPSIKGAGGDDGGGGYDD